MMSVSEILETRNAFSFEGVFRENGCFGMEKLCGGAACWISCIP